MPILATTPIGRVRLLVEAATRAVARPGVTGATRRRVATGTRPRDSLRSRRRAPRGTDLPVGVVTVPGGTATIATGLVQVTEAGRTGAALGTTGTATVLAAMTATVLA